MPKTAVALAAAMIVAGCSSQDGTGDPEPGDTSPSEATESSSQAAEDRPVYSSEIPEEEFCPTGKEIEALESTPENDAVEMYHNATHSLEPQPETPTGPLDCFYFYMAAEEAPDRITEDLATPAAELEVLDEPVDPGSRTVLDHADFPELPDYFQVTGWDHTATEEEPNACLSSTGLLYERCEDGHTLMKEVFTLTGFDSNLDVQIQVEYRYEGDPAEDGSDRLEEIESQSRRIAADFFPMLIDRLPTAAG